MSQAQTVLVTGAGGFIGSHLTEELVRRGHRVRALIHYNSAGRKGWLEESALRDQVDFVSGNVRDYDSVLRAAQGCSQVFHLAALVGIPYSYVSPHAYLRTNLDGAYNILEVARVGGIENVILTSTSEIYGTAKELPMSEQHPIDCQSPYAASKASADQLGLSYSRSFGVPVTIVRPFNTYGPRQSLRAVIPVIVAQLLQGDGLVQLGNIYPQRDFTFIDDTVRGFLAAAGVPEFAGQVVHIGSGAAISIEALALRVGELIGRRIRFSEDTTRIRPAASEVDRLQCDSRKLQAATGWRASVSLDDGLRRTIAWYQTRLERVRPGEYVI